LTVVTAGIAKLVAEDSEEQYVGGEGVIGTAGPKGSFAIAIAVVYGRRRRCGGGCCGSSTRFRRYADFDDPGRMMNIQMLNDQTLLYPTKALLTPLTTLV
jgi:hypothetical protein